jgi:hypothetical protein
MQMKITLPSITVAEAPFWKRSAAIVGPCTATSSRSRERWIASTALDQNRVALGGVAEADGVGERLGEGDGVGSGVGVGVGVGTTVGSGVFGGAVVAFGLAGAALTPPVGSGIVVDGDAVAEVQPASSRAARIVVTRRTTTA